MSNHLLKANLLAIGIVNPRALVDYGVKMGWVKRYRVNTTPAPKPEPVMYVPPPTVDAAPVVTVEPTTTTATEVTQ